jgi:ribosomal protein L37E
MSFGKDNNNLVRIGAYGASSAQKMGNATRKVHVARKGSPPWANNYRPSQGVPDHIRILEGNYQVEKIDENSTEGATYLEEVGWWEHTEHYHATMKKSIICSAGPHRRSKKLAQPCRGCDIYWEDYNERERIRQETGQKVQNPNRISMSSKYTFNVLVYGNFFKAPRMDEHGRTKVKQNGQAFMDWVKYRGPQDDQAYHTSQEKQEGLVMAWPVGYNQFITLRQYADMVSHHCLNCGQQNCVYVQQWVCPACTAPLMELTASSLNPEQIQELVSQPNTCRNCNTRAYPQAVHGCSSCNNPRPARLYDVDLMLQTIKSNNSRQLMVTWVGAPSGIDPKYSDIVSKAADLSTKFAPTPMEQQISIFGPATQDIASAQQPPYAPQFQNQGQWQPQGPPQGQVPYQPQGQPQGQPQYTQNYSQGYNQPVYDPQAAPTQAGFQPGGNYGQYGGQQ